MPIADWMPERLRLVLDRSDRELLVFKANLAKVLERRQKHGTVYNWLYPPFFNPENEAAVLAGTAERLNRIEHDISSGDVLTYFREAAKLMSPSEKELAALRRKHLTSYHYQSADLGRQYKTLCDNFNSFADRCGVRHRGCFDGDW